MKIRLFLFLFVFACLLFASSSYGQNKLITVDAKDIPLNQLLKQVAAQYQIRFAFDDDLLSKQKVTLKINSLPIDSFLKIIEEQYGFGHRFVGGSYVIVKSARQPVEKPEVKKKPSPVQQPMKPLAAPEPQEIHFQWVGLLGYVSDAISGEKIRYCQVIVNNNKELITNELGFFHSKATLKKEVRIVIAHLGYKRLDTLLQVQALTNTISVDLQLEPMSVVLGPIDIVGREKFLIEMPEAANLIAFNPASTINLPRIDQNDMVNALTLIPGIHFLGGQTQGISIRGGAPTENLVLLDGIPVLETSHLFGNLSVINSKYIQQVFVSRGGFGAEYGGRVSGIVEMTGKNGSGPKPTIDLSANLLHANGYVGIPLGKKLSLAGAFRKSYTQLWPNYLFNKLATNSVAIKADPSSGLEGVVVVPNIDYHDINGKLSFRPDKNNEITINYLNGFDAQARQYQFPADGKYFQDHIAQGQTQGYGAKWSSQTTQNWSNKLSVGYNSVSRSSRLNYGKEPNKNGKGGLIKTDYDSSKLSEMLSEWKSELKTTMTIHQLGLGIGTNNITYNYHYQEQKTQGKQSQIVDSIRLNNQQTILQAYYQGEASFLKIIKLKIGLRSTYHLDIGEYFLLPRFSFEFEPWHDIKFTYQYGRYNQSLYRTERIDTDNRMTSNWYLAESRDGTMHATHQIGGFRFDRSQWLVNLEVYTKQTNGKAVFVSKSINDKGLKYISYQKELSSAMHRGIDLFVQYRQRHFHHLFSYSLAESLEKIPGFNQGQFFASPHDQRHRLRLTEMVNYNGWVASIGGYFATGSPVLVKGSTQTLMQTTRLPYFLQVDLSLVRQIKTKHLTAEAGITLLNLLNRENILQSEYFRLTGDDTDLSVKSDMTALSFTPLFFVNLKY